MIDVSMEKLTGGEIHHYVWLRWGDQWEIFTKNSPLPKSPFSSTMPICSSLHEAKEKFKCAHVCASTHASTHTKRINMKQFNMDLNKATGGGDKRELTEEDIHQGLEYVCFSKINRGTWNKRLDRICKIASVVLCFVEGQDLTEIQKSGTTWKNNVVLLLYYFEAGLISPWRDLSFAIRHKNIYYSHEFSKNKNNKTKIFPYHSAFNFYES